MGRRIKEDPQVHRQRIAAAAEQIFSQKGISQTSMDEIAKEAGYSKATLYVYFKNKAEITTYLTLKSMLALKELLQKELVQASSPKHQFFSMCQDIAAYQQEYPYYFSLLLKNINIDSSQFEFPDEEAEIFQAGEDVNGIILSLLNASIEKGIFPPGTATRDKVFSLWGMLSGVINLAADKQEYIEKELNLTKETFLTRSFGLLYQALCYDAGK